MTEIFKAIELILNVGIEMFITIGSVYFILTAIIVIAFEIKRRREPAIVPQKISNQPESIEDLIILYENKELISRPTTFDKYTDTEIPWEYKIGELIIKEGTEREMIDDIKTFLTKEMERAQHEKEQQKHNAYRTKYLDGVYDMGSEILARITSHSLIDDEPIEPWVQGVYDLLDKMWLKDNMKDEEVEQLLTYISDEKNNNPMLLEDEIQTQEYIERQILKINPEKYGIHHIGSIIKVKEDLEIGKSYGDVEFTESMAEYIGRTSIINDVVEETIGNSIDTKYKLSIDVEDHIWSKEMLTVLQNP